MPFESLKNKQITNKINGLYDFKKSAEGVGSWVKYIRNAYGMTVRQLAQRSGISKSVISQTEKGEENDQVTLRSPRQAAQALNCDLVDALVPREPISEAIHRQAEKKARKILAESHLQMELEDQALDTCNLQIQLEELIEEVKKSRQLWDDQ